MHNIRYASNAVSLLLGTSFNTIYVKRVMSFLSGASSTQSCSYTTLYLSNIVNTRDCTLQIPKICYRGLQTTTRICKYALIIPLLAYIFVKRNICKKGCAEYTFSSTITIFREVQVNLSTRFQY